MVVADASWVGGRGMRIPVLVAGLLLAFPVAAGAEDFLINNGLAPPAPSNVIDDARYLDGGAFVRNVGCGAPYFNSPCAAPGAATEVELVEGGDLFRLSAWDSSAITVSGGYVFVASGNDTASVTIEGGNPENVESFGSSTITINDSGPNLGVYAFESSTVVVNGGGWMGVDANDSSTVTVNGGLVSGLLCQGLHGNTITVTGGTVADLWGNEPATVTVSGGAVGTLWLFSSSVVTLVGGSVGETYLGSGATVEAVGRGFAVDGGPVPYGDLVAETGTLTGRLASGDLLDMQFDRGAAPDAGTIRLVEARPVPALSSWGYAALVGCLVGFGLVYRFRRR